MNTKLRNLLAFAIVLIGVTVYGQKNVWHSSSSDGDLNGIALRDLDRKHYQIFTLDFEGFKQALVGAPLRGTTTSASSTIISVPNELGQMESFKVLEAPVFSPELSELYPDIKSYVGFSTSKNGARLRMSVSPQGVQTMVTYMDKPGVFMQPVTGDNSKYIAYSRAARGDFVDDFVCSVMDDFNNENPEAYALANNSSESNRTANDQILKKFRLAVSVTGEYTQYFGGTIAGAYAAINASITRVNEVFETDMAVSFILINAPNIIYTNPSTDPYSPANLGSEGAWNMELQNTLTAQIGNVNYDIGHLFGRSGGGGNAGCIGCVCVANQKGKGYTSPGQGGPEGDNFDIDYVAHEIGHQMGANHTFSFRTEGAGVNVEPGSGSTVMSYAGITGADNVAMHSDPYFHYVSINQILNNLQNRTCWQNNAPETITNAPPVVNAGADYFIPQGTAYVLRGSATDPNAGDALMYSWEQTDSGQVTSAVFGPTNTQGAMARSLPPTASPDRFIPKFSSVLSGNLTQTNPNTSSSWETVSTVARDLNWNLTVRDRQPTATGLNGQTSSDNMKITVVDGEPFVVAPHPNFAPNSTRTISWSVGETASAPINAQNVNIKLSVDGGTTFPYTLASNVPNVGTASVTIPDVAFSDTVRILVEAVDNIFYSVSPNMKINDSPDFVVVNPDGTQTLCGADTATYNLSLIGSYAFTSPIAFSATGLPTGATAVFSPDSLSADGDFTMQINNLGAVPVGEYNISIVGTSGTFSKSTIVTLKLVDDVCASIGSNQYPTSVTGVNFNTISNLNTGKTTGYSNYKSLSTELELGETYPLSVFVNTAGNYPIGTVVWIDWNQNCQFEASEEYVLGVATNVSNGLAGGAPLNITVPLDAVLGVTTMRVSTEFNNFPLACATGFDGEVEDYSIEVVTGLSISDEDMTDFTLFPNPNNGSFDIKFRSTSGSDVKVNVYDIRGRMIFNSTYNNTGDFSQNIQLNAVQSGMYLINVQDGERQITQKIIVN